MKFFQEFAWPLWKDGKQLILDTLFPVYCLVCGKEKTSFICQNCEPKLKRLERQFCAVCQKPSPGGITHPKCKTPFAPEGLISLFDYHDPKVAEVLIKGKYKFIPDVYKTLGRMLAVHILTKHPYVLEANPYLTALPLHKRRLRWRGFNQATVLCQELSQTLEAPSLDSLIRTKATKTQKDLKKEQRIANVAEAFKLNKNVGVRDKNFILIDDVATTGSTLLEAVKVLKRNGSGAVWCLTVARD